MKTTYSEQTTINPRDMQRYLQRARSLRSEAFYRVIKRIGQTIELNFGERERYSPRSQSITGVAEFAPLKDDGAHYSLASAPKTQPCDAMSESTEQRSAA